MHIAIVYGSTTGNTTRLVKFIKQELGYCKHKASIFNVETLAGNKIDLKKYDCCIFSSSTWGGHQPTLQEDFANFWKNFDKAQLKNLNVAVIGLGDLYYPSFCKAVDIITDDVLLNKGKIMLPSLAIADQWEEHEKQIKNWLQDLQKAYKKSNLLG